MALVDPRELQKSRLLDTTMDWKSPSHKSLTSSKLQPIMMVMIKQYRIKHYRIKQILSCTENRLSVIYMTRDGSRSQEMNLISSHNIVKLKRKQMYTNCTWIQSSTFNMVYTKFNLQSLSRMQKESTCNLEDLICIQCRKAEIKSAMIPLLMINQTTSVLIIWMEEIWALSKPKICMEKKWYSVQLLTKINVFMIWQKVSQSLFTSFLTVRL